MLLNNILLYQDKYSISVNEENDTIFYSFDYDIRTAELNMAFQHFHPFYEMCIFLCPNAVHFIEGIPYEVHAFDIVGLSPNRLHKTQYPAGRPCKRLIIQFNMPRQASALSREYALLLALFDRKTPIFRFDSELQKSLCARLNDIFQSGASQDPMRSLLIHQRFLEFLIILYSNRESNIYKNETDLSSIEQSIYSIAGFIHSHYTESLSLESLARCHDLSPSYLSHKFKQVTGFSVTDYIQMTRIRNVQSLLINSDTPITEIPETCGFNSFSQFNRVFRKYIGIAPSKYRKDHRHPHQEQN